MRVDPHSPRGHTPLTRHGLAQLGQLWGEVEGPHTCPPSIGVLYYSLAVTYNIQTYDSHLAKKSSRMSQTFNQGYLFDLNDPS